MSDGSPLVELVFLPSGRHGRVRRGIPLWRAAQMLGVDVDSGCGHQGRCGRCRVFVQYHPTPNARRSAIVGEATCLTAYNWPVTLACQTVVDGEWMIQVPAKPEDS